jgi:hypothetical protein
MANIVEVGFTPAAVVLKRCDPFKRYKYKKKITIMLFRTNFIVKVVNMHIKNNNNWLMGKKSSNYEPGYRFHTSARNLFLKPS